MNANTSLSSSPSSVDTPRSSANRQNLARSRAYDATVFGARLRSILMY